MRTIAHAQKLVQKSVDIVHQFARELRPRVLDDLGLIPALHAFLKGFKAETGIQASLSAFAAVEQMHADKRIIFYRIAQESLTNVIRHSHASRVEVSIRKQDGGACLTIEDNGRGFEVERLLNNKKKQRLGLLGMRERLETVGGKFAIKSIPGKGTTVIALIPLGKAKPKAKKL